MEFIRIELAEIAHMVGVHCCASLRARAWVQCFWEAGETPALQTIVD